MKLLTRVLTDKQGQAYQLTNYVGEFSYLTEEAFEKYCAQVQDALDKGAYPLVANGPQIHQIPRFKLGYDRIAREVDLLEQVATWRSFLEAYLELARKYMGRLDTDEIEYVLKYNPEEKIKKLLGPK